MQDLGTGARPYCALYQFTPWTSPKKEDLGAFVRGDIDPAQSIAYLDEMTMSYPGVQHDIALSGFTFAWDRSTVEDYLAKRYPNAKRIRVGETCTFTNPGGYAFGEETPVAPDPVAPTAGKQPKDDFYEPAPMTYDPLPYTEWAQHQAETLPAGGTALRDVIVRDEAGVELTTLPGGASCAILAAVGDRYLVRVGDIVGYVPRATLDVSAARQTP